MMLKKKKKKEWEIQTNYCLNWSDNQDHQIQSKPGIMIKILY